MIKLQTFLSSVKKYSTRYFGMQTRGLNNILILQVLFSFHGLVWDIRGFFGCENFIEEKIWQDF